MRILLFLPVRAMLVIATACGHATQVAAAPEPLKVLVADVQQKDVPLHREWIGIVGGFVNAEIKAQGSGYLVKQEYTEGSFDRRGQPPQARAQAEAEVAEANQHRVQLDVDRYTPLFQRHAIAEQDLGNFTQNNMAAKAQLQARPVIQLWNDMHHVSAT